MLPRSLVKTRKDTGQHQTATPPTVKSMGNNFEAKHPRAKDGKFTEKLRKEANVALELEKQPFTPPDTPQGCGRGEVFAGKVEKHYIHGVFGEVTDYECEDHDQILHGEWHLMGSHDSGKSSIIRYRTADGYVNESYDGDGNLIVQSFMDRNYKTIREKNVWSEKIWRKNGNMSSRSKNVKPRNQEEARILADEIALNGGTLLVSESFDECGEKEGEVTYQVGDKVIYAVDDWWRREKGVRYRTCRNFERQECAPENKPSSFFYRNDKLITAEYRVARDGGIMYHRTDGPAVIDNRKPEGQRERYFLEGVEYIKSEWEKKVGK